MLGNDLADLRAHNRRIVLRALLDAPGPAGLAPLAAATGLSRPTVDQALRSLVEDGLVDTATAGSTPRGGRPGRSYRFRRETTVVGGAVLGLRTLDVALAGADGTLLAQASIPAGDGADRPERAYACLAEMLTAAHLPENALAALTVGIVGVRSPDGTIRRNDSYPELSTPGYFTALSDRLAALGADLLIENDADLAALAEYEARRTPAFTDVVGLHIDTAVGCGLILRGALHRGAGNAAGELGYDPRSGWARAHRDLLADADPDGGDVRALYRRAEAGQADAVAAVQRLARSVLPGLTSVVLTVDPQAVIVGGPVCAARDVIAPILTDHLAACCPDPPALEFSVLGRDCVALGALETARRHVRAALLGPIAAADSAGTAVPARVVAAREENR